jgi:hypothetical protein
MARELVYAPIRSKRSESACICARGFRRPSGAEKTYAPGNSCESASRSLRDIVAELADELATMPGKVCAALSLVRLKRGPLAWVTLLLVVAVPTSAAPKYPLKASVNHRYLVDQNGTPVFLFGDSSAQTFFSNLSVADGTSVMADRASYGFNALWAHVIIGDNQLYGRSNLSTYDGIVPFTGTLSGGQYDLNKPNSAYFSRIDSMVNAAAAQNMVVFLDVLENYSEMSIFEANGNSVVYAYGQYLGNRYKSFPNIVWMAGNDFQSWTNGTDNSLAQSVMQGILSVDSNHLMTSELNYFISGSSDDTLLGPLCSIDAAYTYYPTYGEVLAQYNAGTTTPVIMEEGFYENNNYGTPPNSLNALGFRKQAYWTALWGGLGGFFHGNQSELPLTTPISGWQSSLNTTTATQMKYFASFINSSNWWLLAPDQTHALVTAGYGTATGVETGGGQGSGRIDTDNFVTTSFASDGSFSLSYLPVNTTLMVAMSKFAGSVTARWFDPTNNTYAAISGSPFANSGTHTFVSPGNNSAGDPDWVLVLQTNGSTSSQPAPPTGLKTIVN